MKTFDMLFLVLAGMLAFVAPAAAQSADFMRSECSSAGKIYFCDFDAPTEMKYNRQSLDGTHAASGRIYLGTRAEDFACSCTRDDKRTIRFYAQARRQEIRCTAPPPHPANRPVPAS